MKYYKISEEDLIKLIEKAKFLDALESYGLDNCDGRCFGCHNSLCVNSIFPYEELERITRDGELHETHNSHRNVRHCS